MTILDEIAEYKRTFVAECKRRVPLEETRRRAEKQGPTRNFAGALKASGMSIIAEIKRQSPSRGVIRADVDPATVARIYETNGARAISVLTDERYFGGSLKDLGAVRDAANLPLLRKEFVVDAYQIYEARAAGADAVLLIVSLLTKEALRDYISLTAELGLAALVEIHTGKELEQAMKVDARIIGINNRNLKTFKTDLKTTFDLVRDISKDRIIVSESGIQSGADIVRLQTAGVDAVLVGEALMRKEDIGGALRALIGGG
ncbi:MAG: indole-3-glycerol phosphate synthase TrpC [Candidatus Latescibacterota bacterium]|nr:MAG: indole-3-glycerol phosphate synthase TrpC [Candidatus Latescibacterota bacterium]